MVRWNYFRRLNFFWGQNLLLTTKKANGKYGLFSHLRERHWLKICHSFIPFLDYIHSHSFLFICPTSFPKFLSYKTEFERETFFPISISVSDIDIYFFQISFLVFQNWYYFCPFSIWFCLPVLIFSIWFSVSILISISVSKVLTGIKNQYPISVSSPT